MADEIKPYRAQLNIHTAHADFDTVREMLAGLEEDAEARGWHVEFSFVGEMPIEQVIPGSEVDNIIKGVDPETEEPS